VGFPCSGCGAWIDTPPDRFVLRCPACRAVLRSRAVDAGGSAPLFDVEVAGQPETRRRVELAWDPAQRRRLSEWLLVASIVTVALVLVLFLLARAL
jgi:hypothetical protein